MGNELFNETCGAVVDCFLLGGEMVPGPRRGGQRGVPIDRCGDVGAGGRGGGSHLESSSSDLGLDGSSPRDGRGPGSPLGGWGVPKNRCGAVGRDCREGRGGLGSDLNDLAAVHSAKGYWCWF